MNIKLDIKPFQETLHADMCGPASLKIVMDYYAVNKSENELAQLTNLIPGIGVSDSDIIEAAQTLGFNTEIKNNSTFKDIEFWLNKGAPVIVDWFTRGRSDYNDSEVADGHYSVVIGLDDDYIYLQDPEIGKERKIGREDFMKVWFDFTGENVRSDELVIRQLIAVFL